MASEITGLPGQSIKRFEQSNGLDTALYKTYYVVAGDAYLTFYVSQVMPILTFYVSGAYPTFYVSQVMPILTFYVSGAYPTFYVSQVMPILRILYAAQERNSHHIYMALIVLLILSEDDGFNKAIHETVRNSKHPKKLDRAHPTNTPQ